MQQIEVSLKDFAIVVLRKWKWVLAIGLIFCLFAAVFSYFSQSHVIEKMDEDSLAQIREINIETKQSTINQYLDKISATTVYNNNSLLMGANPYDKKTSQLSFAVSVEPEVFSVDIDNKKIMGMMDLKNNVTENIINRYINLAQAAPLKEILKDDLSQDLDEKYLREIIRTEVPTRGMITIRVMENSHINSQAAVETLYQYLTDKKSAVTALEGEHKLSVVSRNTITEVDMGLVDLQEKQRNLVPEYVKEITKLSEEIKELEGIKKQLAKEEKEKPAPSMMINVLRGGLTGLLIGMVVAILYTIVMYISKLPIQVPDQLEKRIGLRYLGGYRPQQSNLSGKWADHLSGMDMLTNSQGIFDIVVANLKNVIGQKKQIFVTGTLPEDVICDFAKKISDTFKNESIVFTCGSGLDTNAKTIQMLSQADGVLIVERVGSSSLKKIHQEKFRIESYKKDILGYVLI